MCGRYAQTRSVEAVRAWSGATNPPVNLAPSWNVAPTQTAPVVRRHPETGERHLDMLRWGVIPRWAKDMKHRPQPTNARAETVATSPMFRDAFARRRCIVPAEAFYEWRAEPDGKAPFAIAPASGAPLAFAGIWDGWKSPEGEVVRTFAIVTTEANAEMREVHVRMPVILAEADWPAWLGEGEAAELLRPAPDGTLRLWPVSRAVNSVRNNGPELLVPMTEQPGPQGGANSA